MPRLILFSTIMRTPGTALLSQIAADRIMREHHAEATRRGLPPKMPRVRIEQEGDELVHILDYRAPRC